jgi:hypothetical protein
VSTQSDVSLRSLKRERAKAQCSREGIPYEICGRCFRAGRCYLRLPWEMRQATRCRLCTQCMAEKRRRKSMAARSRPATPCRVDGCRRPADPIRYTICGYHYRRLPQTRRSNQRYKKLRAASHKLFLARWAMGRGVYPLHRIFDDRNPAEHKAHMLAVRARQKLKKRVRRELASGERQMPPLYLLSPSITPETAVAGLHLPASCELPHRRDTARLRGGHTGAGWTPESRIGGI